MCDLITTQLCNLYYQPQFKINNVDLWKGTHLDDLMINLVRDQPFPTKKLCMEISNTVH